MSSSGKIPLFGLCLVIILILEIVSEAWYWARAVILTGVIWQSHLTRYCSLRPKSQATEFNSDQISKRSDTQSSGIEDRVRCKPDGAESCRVIVVNTTSTEKTKPSMEPVKMTSDTFEGLELAAFQTLSQTLQLREGLNDFLLFKPVSIEFCRLGIWQNLKECTHFSSSAGKQIFPHKYRTLMWVIMSYKWHVKSIHTVKLNETWLSLCVKPTYLTMWKWLNLLQAETIVPGVVHWRF